MSTAGQDTLWGSKFYVPVACFLLFNIGDYVGRLLLHICLRVLLSPSCFFRFLAGLVQWPKPGKLGSYITLGLSLARYAPEWFLGRYSPIFIRFVFIPLFLICNVRPGDRGVTDVYMASDVAYIIVMALFRWKNHPFSLKVPWNRRVEVWSTNMLPCSISNGYVGSICMMSAPQVISFPRGTFI